MRRFKVYLFVILISLICWSCEKETTAEEVVYIRITGPSSDFGSFLEVATEVEYFNSNGYNIRTERQYSDPKKDDYVTYKYDTNNNIIEVYDSNGKTTTKFIYNNNSIIRKEFYDSLNELTNYISFEYSNQKINNQKKYIESETDKITKYYYNNGLLDSVVVDPTEGGASPQYSRVEFKYNSFGKIIELSRYANMNRTNIVYENVELLNKENYQYDENSNLILHQFTNRIQTSENTYIFKSTKCKYFYNEYNNLIRKDLYDYDNKFLGSVTTKYVKPVNIKLITREF